MSTIEHIVIKHRQQWEQQYPSCWHSAFRQLTMEMMFVWLIGRAPTQSIPKLCHWSQLVSQSLSAFLPLHWRKWRYHQACKARDALLAELSTTIPQQNDSTNHLSPLSLLLAHEDKWIDEQTRHEIGLQLLFLLFAGHETLSLTLTKLQQTLGQYPNIIAQARGEQRAVGNQPLTIDKLDQMTYLSPILLEVMRLHPTINALFRRVTTSCTFEDYALPVGSLVASGIHALHFDDQIFDQPHRFDPDRFGAEHKSHPFSFMGFGAGTHACLGKSLAILIMKIVALHLLQFNENDNR